MIELAIVMLVMGILFFGIVSGVGFLDRYRLGNAQSMVRNGPVDKIEDLALWLEPVMEQSFNHGDAQDGDLISLWNDANTKVITKINFIQSDVSQRPLYVRKGIGGMPSVLFSGNQSLKSHLVPIASGHNKYTVILVMQQQVNYGKQVVFYQGNDNCDGGHAGIYLALDYVYGFACGKDDTQSFTYQKGKPYEIIYRVDGSQNDNVTIYVNGEKHGPVPRDVRVGSLDSGVGFGGDGDYFQGMVAEVIVYNRALNDIEIGDVRGYVKGKYGIYWCGMNLCNGLQATAVPLNLSVRAAFLKALGASRHL